VPLRTTTTLTHRRSPGADLPRPSDPTRPITAAMPARFGSSSLDASVVAVDHGLVRREVLAGHAIETEVGDGVLSYLCPVECPDPRHRFDRLFDVADEEPGHGVLDELRHGSASIGHDGRATRHRLDDAVAERLLEVDEVQQRDGAAEHVGPELGPDGSDVAHL